MRLRAIVVIVVVVVVVVVVVARERVIDALRAWKTTDFAVLGER